MVSGEAKQSTIDINEATTGGKNKAYTRQQAHKSDSRTQHKHNKGSSLATSYN